MNWRTLLLLLYHLPSSPPHTVVFMFEVLCFHPLLVQVFDTTCIPHMFHSYRICCWVISKINMIFFFKINDLFQHAPRPSPVLVALASKCVIITSCRVCKHIITHFIAPVLQNDKVDIWYMTKFYHGQWGRNYDDIHNMPTQALVADAETQ